MGAAIVRADALHLPLRDESVDLVVTSPPYFALRSYQDDGEHYEGQIGSEASPQDFLEALWGVTAECVRVLKPTGSIFVNLGDKYAGSGGHNNSGIQGATSAMADRKHTKARNVVATRRSAPDSYNKATIGGARAKSLMGLPWRYAIGCIDRLELILRAELIWSKPNGLPESVTDRVRRSHEQWFHFTKEGRYFAAVDEVREPYESPGSTRLGRLPSSVWTVATEPLVVPDYVDADHFAAFPQEWPRRLILGWTPRGICVECGEGRRPVVATERVGVSTRSAKGPRTMGSGREGSGFERPGADSWQNTVATITGYSCACDKPTAPTRPAVVLDPFGGTGTTAMVARALGRFGISLDLSADYLRLARWRIFESGHASKSRERTNREAQGSLLGGVA